MLHGVYCFKDRDAVAMARISYHANLGHISVPHLMPPGCSAGCDQDHTSSYISRTMPASSNTRATGHHYIAARGARSAGISAPTLTPCPYDPIKHTHSAGISAAIIQSPCPYDAPHLPRVDHARCDKEVSDDGERCLAHVRVVAHLPPGHVVGQVYRWLGHVARQVERWFRHLSAKCTEE